MVTPESHPTRTRTRTKTVKAPTSLRPRVTTSSSNKPTRQVGRIYSGRPQTLPGVAHHSLQLAQPTIRRESHEREPGFPLSVNLSDCPGGWLGFPLPRWL